MPTKPGHWGNYFSSLTTAGWESGTPSLPPTYSPMDFPRSQR